MHNVCVKITVCRYAFKHVSQSIRTWDKWKDPHAQRISFDGMIIAILRFKPLRHSVLQIKSNFIVGAARSAYRPFRNWYFHRFILCITQPGYVHTYICMRRVRRLSEIKTRYPRIYCTHARTHEHGHAKVLSSTNSSMTTLFRSLIARVGTTKKEQKIFA